MEFIKFKNKQETRAMRFVQDACSTDPSRPILTSIRIENGKTIAADGYRLHIAPTPETLKEYEGKQLKPERRIRVNPQPEEFEEVEGTFPDWQQIVPDRLPVYRIALDKNFLADLGNMPSDSDVLILEFGSPNHPVMAYTNSQGEEYQALIMPMHIDKTSFEVKETKLKRLERENRELKQELEELRNNS